MSEHFPIADADATANANEVVTRLGWQLAKPNLLVNHVNGRFICYKDATVYAKSTNDEMVQVVDAHK